MRYTVFKSVKEWLNKIWDKIEYCTGIKKNEARVIWMACRKITKNRCTTICITSSLCTEKLFSLNIQIYIYNCAQIHKMVFWEYSLFFFAWLSLLPLSLFQHHLCPSRSCRVKYSIHPLFFSPS